jgi:hypothetical protein
MGEVHSLCQLRISDVGPPRVIKQRAGNRVFPIEGRPFLEQSLRRRHDDCGSAFVSPIFDRVRETPEVRTISDLYAERNE